MHCLGALAGFLLLAGALLLLSGSGSLLSLTLWNGVVQCDSREERQHLCDGQ